MSSSQGVLPPSVVQRYLSSPRVGTYVAASGGDLEAAVRLYRWNASVAAAFWEVLGHGEVILRNVIHNELTTHHHLRGDPGEWFDDPRGVLTQQALDDVKVAKRRAGRGAPGGKVVAERSFGFWRYLLVRRYAATLWPAIRHAFPHLPRGERGRRTLEAHVSALHQFRNRIAHHEPLISIPLRTRLQSLEYVLDRIDPQIRAWALDDDGRLGTLLNNRP